MLTAALFLAMQTSGLLQSQFDQISPAVAAARVTTCGLGNVTVHFDDALQEEVLTPLGAAAATDTQLACADKAVSFYTLVLPPNVQHRFDVIRAARLDPIILADARAALAKRGLLRRLPPYHVGKSDDRTFARNLERLCGAAATGALTSQYGPHALSPSWSGSGTLSKAHVDALDCIMNATTASGFELHFIGNAAY